MKIKYDNLRFIIILLLGLFIFEGCTLANRKKAYRQIVTEEVVYEAGRGDAYLFDVKIYRDGRKNSVRLDIYRTADMMALFARGYLGKGVLKGLITKDSILIYFPTENEYFSGKVSELIGEKCADGLPFEKLINRLFQKLPVELEDKFPQFYINVISEKGKTREYRLISEECPENIELGYDYKNSRFILNKIDYSNSDETFRFSANRRKVKTNINIPAEKLELKIPASAIRISP